MVKYSGVGFCITLFGSNTEPKFTNIHGEVALSNFTLDSSNTIDLYTRVGYFKPEEEGEIKTSISDYQVLVNKFRKGYEIELMPLNINVDKIYIENLFDILRSFKYKYIFSDQARSTAFGAKLFDYNFVKELGYCLPINITNYNPEPNDELAELTISFTCKAKNL